MNDVPPGANAAAGDDDSRPGTSSTASSNTPSADTPAHGEGQGAHKISVATNRHRVRVIHQGVTVADTLGALTLSETGYDDVFYFPRADVNMARLERSTHTSKCPFKGDASYFHLLTEEGAVDNAAWTYEAPLETARQIKGYLAFYASRVDRIDQTS